MQINLNTVLFIIIILIALHLLGRHGYVDICCCPDSVHETTVVIDTITRHNEIFISGEDIPSPKFEKAMASERDTTHILRDTIVKVYRDTIFRDGISLSYSHRIRGDLLASHYNIMSIEERPIILQTGSSSRTSRAGVDLTLPDLLHGRVYGMVGYHGVTRDVGIGGAYVGKDYIFSYMYGLGNQTHAIGAGLRIF